MPGCDIYIFLFLGCNEFLGPVGPRAKWPLSLPIYFDTFILIHLFWYIYLCTMIHIYFLCSFFTIHCLVPENSFSVYFSYYYKHLLCIWHRSDTNYSTMTTNSVYYVLMGLFFFYPTRGKSWSILFLSIFLAPT